MQTVALLAPPAAEGLEVSRIIKGCWQLSGGHDGDRATNRTKGQAAIDDFQPFVLAGITTFDTGEWMCSWRPLDGGPALGSAPATVGQVTGWAAYSVSSFAATKPSPWRWRASPRLTRVSP